MLFEFLYFLHYISNFFIFYFRINFWIFSIIIKLLPCLLLTIISFILVKVLCEASKRKQKLKDYNTVKTGTDTNGHTHAAGHVHNGQKYVN